MHPVSSRSEIIKLMTLVGRHGTFEVSPVAYEVPVDARSSRLRPVTTTVSSPIFFLPPHSLTRCLLLSLRVSRTGARVISIAPWSAWRLADIVVRSDWRLGTGV